VPLELFSREKAPSTDLQILFVDMTQKQMLIAQASFLNNVCVLWTIIVSLNVCICQIPEFEDAKSFLTQVPAHALNENQDLLKANSDQEEGKNASKVEDEEDSEWDDRMPSRQHQIDNDNA
jgi:hypothetical protein